MSLVEHLAELGRELRAAGVRVTTGDEVDALDALVRIDLGDPEEVRWALRAALKIRPRDAAAFEALFARRFRGTGRSETTTGAPRAEHGPSRPRAPGGWPFAAMGGPDAEIEVEVPEGGEPGASHQALLRRKPFEACDEHDLAAMEPVLARLADRLATRRSRRLVPTRGRGMADLRRSLRRALATGGELVWLARRARPVELPRIVFLCDTSGSMGLHARFLLAFARGLVRVARSTEVFAFNTELTRITSWLRAGRLELVLARLVASVPDWAGGTRIGECLETFVDAHQGELVDSRTVVIIFSDGLERGEPVVLARALSRIQSRARRVIWLNPLLSDPRYEPTARGMAAALPFVDKLAPAHDLASLERLIPECSV